MKDKENENQESEELENKRGLWRIHFSPFSMTITPFFLAYDLTRNLPEGIITKKKRIKKNQRVIAMTPRP